MLNHERIATIFIYCTRDHNLEFHPAREYLQTSRMQAHWHEFEYIRTSLAKKVGIEFAASTAHILGSTGMGVLLGGLVGGPAGMVTGLALGAIGSTTAQSVIVVTKGIRTKIRRQWGLHKGRNYALRTNIWPHEHLTYMLMPYDCWPGYAHFRQKRPAHVQDDRDLGRHSNIFANLKERLYFKPPKSGDRLNRCSFEYFLLSKTSVEEAQNADVLWNTSSCWPMLDYVFFSQYFYFELNTFLTILGSQKCAVFSTCNDRLLQSFFYTTRFHFLARDFYLDHFFDKALPRYEMAFTHQNHLEIGSNLLKEFFQASRLSARDLLEEFQKFIFYLPEETQIAFRHTIRSLVNLDTSSAPLPLDEEHDEVQKILNQNQADYESVLIDPRLNESQRRMNLRHLIEERRKLMRNATQFVKHKPTTHEVICTDITRMVEKAYNPFDISMALTRHIFAQDPHSKNYSGNAGVNSMLGGGMNGALGIVADFFNDGVSVIKENVQKKFRSEAIKEAWRNLELFYGGVRLLCGTVDFVYHAVTNSSILLKFFNCSVIIDSIVDPLLLGSNIINVAFAFGIQNQSKGVYAQMDRECLLIVDSLVAPDIHASECQILIEELIAPPNDSLTKMTNAELLTSALNARDDAHIFTQRDEFPNSEILIHADRMTCAFANRAEVLANGGLCFDTETGTKTATSGVSTVLNCTRMANAWARATQIVFLILKMEKSRTEHSKIDEISQNTYLLAKYIVNTTIQLCLAAHTNYQEYMYVQNLHDKTLLLHMCDQSRFVCSIFNRYMNSFKTWLQRADAIFQLELADLIRGFHPNTLSYARLIEILTLVENALNKVPERSLHEKKSAFHDCAHLNLGLKFIKPPTMFTAQEKQALFSDFGRVLRHLFMKTQSPFEKIVTLKSQLDSQLAEIKACTSPTDRKHVAHFLTTYFDYINVIHDLYIFIYYARVYQFVLESARAEFLDSSRSVRSDMMRALSSAEGYNEVIEEIKLLLEQLDDEEMLLSATL